MTTESEFLAAYDRIKVAHKQTMTEVDEAVKHEENERHLEAIAAYERCIQSIDEVFTIPVGLPENIDVVEKEWSDACVKIQQLKTAKTEVCYRLKTLRAKHAPVDGAAMEAKEAEDNSIDEPEAKRKPSVLCDNPPTYYDISMAGGTTKTYREIINGLRDVIATKDSGVIFDTLFHSQAKLYKIEPNGVVSTIAGDTSMSLVMCTVSDKWQFLNGSYFIQCTMPDDTPTTSNAASRNMIWIYPLIPAVTMCHRTDYGAFILPDMESNIPGAAFGLVLVEPDAEQRASDDNDELTDLQQFLLDLLEAVLGGRVETLSQQFTTQGLEDGSQQVSRYIVTGADFIARNLVWGAEKTGELMNKSRPYIISRISQAPPDAPPVSSTVQNSVEVAKTVTSAAASATGWLAGKVGSASMAIGRFLGPHIQTQGAKVLEKGFGYDPDEANSKMEGALTIAAGAVEGFSTVYNGLETSAKILGTNLSDNSVRIIEHKYGPSAGDVAAGTFETLGNAFHVSQNVNYITPKGIAKKMAKHTGKAVVDDYKRALRNGKQFVPAGALYPDLRALKDI